MIVLVLAAAPAASQLPAVAPEPAPPRPNVLMITMDELAYDWVGALGPGFPKVDTPALDALVARGVTFRRHYAENEVCHPSRSTMLTGRPPLCHGALDNGVELPASELTLAELLQSLGWRTGAFGKVHTLAEGAWQGFDVVVDKDQIVAWLETQGVYLDQRISWLDKAHGTGVLHVTPAEHPETILAEVAMDFMADSAGRSWFAYVSFSNPHPPSVASADAWAGVDPLDVPMVLPQLPDLLGKPPFTISRVKDLGLHTLQSSQARLHYAAYAAMIEETDRQIGRVLHWVESNVTDRPTIVVFTSDHGDMACQLGLFDKLFGPYENAVHVPAIVVMPGVLPAGVAVDALTQHSDLMPTVLDLLGIRIPAAVKGHSLVDLARGGPPVRDYVFCGREAGDISYMISDGLHSLIMHPGLPGELYDLQADPQQIVNLWNDPLHAAEQDRLTRDLAAWRASACL